MLFRFFMSAAEVVETTVATVTPTPVASESQLAALSIFSKGLFTTLLGIGVFLVLALFYVSIKIMQRKHSQTPTDKE